MYRVVRMSGNYYAVKMNKLNATEMREIEQLVYESIPVIIVDSLDDLEDLGIEREDVRILSRN